MRQNRFLKRGMVAVKKKRFSVEQIVGILKQAEVGVPVAELIRKVGISEQTFYRWKKRYAKLKIDQVRQRKLLQEENQRLKRLVADLTLDRRGCRPLRINILFGGSVPLHSVFVF